MKKLFFLIITGLLLSNCSNPDSQNSRRNNYDGIANTRVEPLPFLDLSFQEKQDEKELKKTDFDTSFIPRPIKPKQIDTKPYKEEENIYQFVQQKPTLKIDSLLIKRGTVNFQVANLEKSTIAISKIVKNFGGYIAFSNQSWNDYELRTEFEIKVPSPKFELLLTELIKESVFLEKKEIKTQDVTEEFVDTYARINAKKVVENRYLSILQQAKTVEEILKVEEQLRIIHEEIEVKQGRLKYLKDQISYSTIWLTIIEKLPYKKDTEIGFFTRLGQAFSQGWDNLQYFIIGLAGLWWFWILLFAVIYFVRKWILKIRTRRDTIKETSEKPENNDIKSES